MKQPTPQSNGRINAMQVNVTQPKINRTLEDAIDAISELRIDLFAEVIVQEEKASYHIVPGSDYGSGPCSFDKDWDEEKIIEQEEIRGHDVLRREAARARLRQIRDSLDELPVIRYAASKALGEKPSTMLGYYPLRIFVNDVIRSPTVKFAAAAALAGLVYEVLKLYRLIR